MRHLSTSKHCCLTVMVSDGRRPILMLMMVPGYTVTLHLTWSAAAQE